MKISNKEAHEPKFWICIFVDTNYLTAEEKDGLLTKTQELIIILQAILKSAKE